MKGMLLIPPTFRQSVTTSITLELPNTSHMNMHALRGHNVIWLHARQLGTLQYGNVHARCMIFSCVKIAL